MRTPAIRDGYLACFVEACRQGPRGPVRDLALIGRPWGFDLASLKVPVALWQGEQDRNVPSLHGQYLASVISDCRATFYPNDAHISVPLHHQQEILDVFAA
jgi:pimeloyl-ACP methyl ester carboxylesterase